ncbi:hypothetical protein [Spirosoma luteum]|uniref:hypothetical protein n=1 Tax=Spirosoma luteum TaxID=431553 RepID=UPI000374014B|nr:hypothetical protein [Spirosoma luteum]
MIPNLPTYIPVTFGLTVLATLLLFYRAVAQASTQETRKKETLILSGLIGWLIIQGVLSLNGVYKSVPVSGPPRILLFGILPAMLTIISVFVTPAGRRFADSLPLANITWLNTVRVVVELVLYWLFLNKVVPELITFEGRNFDVFSGLTAPLVAYVGLTKHKLSRQLVLGWNLICLALLINVVVYAFLSAPSPLQKFAFDQPNIAILNLPFSWLPTFVVPVVLLGHLVSIRQLLK